METYVTSLELQYIPGVLRLGYPHLRTHSRLSRAALLARACNVVPRTCQLSWGNGILKRSNSGLRLHIRFGIQGSSMHWGIWLSVWEFARASGFCFNFRLSGLRTTM